MSDLFGVLSSAAGALKAFQSALDVTQNNVSNSQTPGYVKQTASLESLSFDLRGGLNGGVEAGAPQSSRNEYAEAAVRQQVTLLGSSSQLATSLDPIEQVFNVTGSGGIGNAIDALFQSFSAWSNSPGDAGAQSAVLNAAAQVSVAFQQAAKQLGDVRTSVEGDLQTTVQAINQAASEIQKYNIAQRGPTQPDAGLDAQLNAALEQLAQYSDVQTLRQPDGTVTVLLGGQVPIVNGDQVNPLSVSYPTPSNAANPSAAPDAAILDSNGTDVTAKLADGQLGALLSVHNQALPQLVGGPSDTGQLNTLASDLASAVNGILSNAGGAALFTYNASPTSAASTLALNSSLQPGDLVAADPGPPPVSNGTALKLSSLGNDPSQGPQGQTFTQFYASMSSWIGNQLNQAQTASDAQTQSVAQARALRQQLSGVSLDEQAMQLIQLQRSYQAASRLVTVIDSVLQSVIDMVQ